MKIPSLNYNLFEDVFGIDKINKEKFDASILLSDLYIYFVDFQNILFKTDKIGNHEKIAIIDSPTICLDPSGDIIFVQNKKIAQENKQTNINCNGKFVIDNDIFVCSDFGNQEIITKYEFKTEKELCKSQLINIDQIRIFDNYLAIKNKENISLLDLSLNLLYSIPVTAEQFALNKDLVFVTKNDILDQYIICFDKEKLVWQYKLDGPPKSLTITDNFVICNTDLSSFCFDYSGKIIWIKKPGFEDCTPFIDQTEHIIAVNGNMIKIYEIQTGILVWKKSLNYPICGEPVIDRNGFAVSTYDGGGIHYFGANKWNLNF